MHFRISVILTVTVALGALGHAPPARAQPGPDDTERRSRGAPVPAWASGLWPEGAVVAWTPWPGGKAGEILALVDDSARSTRGGHTARLERVSPDGRRQRLLGRSVNAIRTAFLADVTRDGKPDLVCVWDIQGPGEQLVVLDVAGAKPVVRLAVPAHDVAVEDAAGMGTPDIVATVRRPGGISEAPVVYRWTRDHFERPTAGLDAFYARVTTMIQRRLDRTAKLKEGQAGFADHLVDWLDLGYVQEIRGDKRRAWDCYSHLLAQAHVPTRMSREEYAHRAGIVELTNETRMAMARLAGLRVIGEPRPSASPSPSPGATPGATPAPSPGPSRR